MEMVAEGGHLLILTPVNNFMGHGFYQFSPGTFSQVLNDRNGFTISHMLIFEDHPRARWYEVSLPEVVNGRITLCNKKPTYLFVVAKRTKRVAQLDIQPQQSDYVVTWNQQGTVDNTQRGVGRINLAEQVEGVRFPLRQSPLVEAVRQSFLRRVRCPVL